VWGWAATTSPQWTLVFITWVPEVEHLAPPTPLVFQLDPPAQPCAVAEQPMAAEQVQAAEPKKIPKSLKRRASLKRKAIEGFVFP